MNGVSTYNPLKVMIALGNHAVTGYAEDSFVTIEPLGDGVTSKAGCDGEIVRNVDPNSRYTIKLALLASSPTSKWLSNKFYMDKKNGNGTFPVLVKDITGKDKFSTEAAWVTKPASITKGKEASNKEWTLETGQAEFVYE